MFIVGQEDNGVFPARTIANGIDHLGYVSLAALNVDGRMFVILGRGSRQAKVRIDKGHRRQVANGSLGKESCQRKKMRISASWGEEAEAGTLRSILKVICPSYVVFIQQVEDRSGNRLVTSATRWRKGVVGSEMPKGCRSHQIRTIGKRWPQNGRKVTVTDGELLRQVIIKRNIRLIVKADGLIIGGGFDSIIDLLGSVVHANESIIQTLPKSVSRI